jgi:hypothetical protein
LISDYKNSNFTTASVQKTAFEKQNQNLEGNLRNSLLSITDIGLMTFRCRKDELNLTLKSRY